MLLNDLSICFAGLCPSRPQLHTHHVQVVRDEYVVVAGWEVFLLKSGVPFAQWQELTLLRERISVQNASRSCLKHCRSFVN